MSHIRKWVDGRAPDLGTPDFVRWMTALLLNGVGLALAYWLWPEGITDLAWAEMRPRSLLLAALSGAVPLVFLAMAWSLWRD
jgi:hypothetical protein